MSNLSKIILVSVIGVISLIVFLMNMSYGNTHADIHNQATAQQKANEVIYDEVWKVLQQKAGILDKWSTDFKSVYGNIMSKRYEGKDPMFNWIQEHNPNFTSEMYKDLSVAIEAYRGKFSRVQQKLIDIQREDNNLHSKQPSNWFVGKKKDLEINIVTSTKTEQTFQTGKEDDIDLFKK